ncbi:retinol dehydrogenase 11-like [Tribolium madens]|uniref:retinol dehydrogenase 11-like n=1 Tax=Tribolium madens TaxID=41895 RepID=UPI001CF730FD|nr:retinol dehydrogenase 11-like [Tribolium madens]
MILSILPLLFVFCALFKIYLKVTTGWCKSHTCLVGKTALITGGNAGIGYETALDLAKRGARVILACRSHSKGDEALRKIVKETGNENIVVKILNMSSFESVRAFAREINKTESRLDILVNNAGTLAFGGEVTSDNLPVIMQTNHFSSFLLTQLLLDLLKKSAPSRIVNVSSAGAKRAFDFNVEKITTHGKDYVNSKLCNIFFTQELARRLEGTGVTAYSLHPGLVKTNIFDSVNGYLKLLVDIVVGLFSKTPEEGAQTTIYCSVAKGIENWSGAHFSDCRKVETYKTARDSDLAKKVWEKSEQIVQLL